MRNISLSHLWFDSPIENLYLKNGKSIAVRAKDEVLNDRILNPSILQSQIEKWKIYSCLTWCDCKIITFERG